MILFDFPAKLRYSYAQSPTWCNILFLSGGFYAREHPVPFLSVSAIAVMFFALFRALSLRSKVPGGKVKSTWNFLSLSGRSLCDWLSHDPLLQPSSRSDPKTFWSASFSSLARSLS